MMNELATHYFLIKVPCEALHSSSNCCIHCVKSVQIRSYFWSECGKIRTRNSFILNTFHAVILLDISS